jgi:uncharacterized protein YceK
MISPRMLGFAIAAVIGATSLSGCASMMTAEQKKQGCDSYGAMLTMPQLTAEQRKQTLDAMRQMSCENTPAA